MGLLQKHKESKTPLEFEGVGFNRDTVEKHLGSLKDFETHYKKSLFGSYDMSKKIGDRKFIPDANQKEKLAAAYEFLTGKKS